MKKLLLVCLLIPIFCLGQIGKAEEKVDQLVLVGVTNKMVGYPKLEKYKGQDRYMITYKNLEYTEIVDIKVFSFDATEKDLDYLYNALLERLVKKDKSPKTIKVGDVTLNYKKQSSSISVNVDHPTGETDGWMGYLSKKQLANLFGKGK